MHFMPVFPEKLVDIMEKSEKMFFRFPLRKIILFKEIIHIFELKFDTSSM